MRLPGKAARRRYETPNGLARDVERFLTGKPVDAHPPSVGYRLSKFLKQNKGPVVWVSLILFLLLAGIIWIFCAYFEAGRQEQIAREEATEKKKALENEAQERGYAEAIAQFLMEDFLALTSVEGQGRFGGEELTRNATLRELLDRAAEKLKERKDLAPRTEAKLNWIIGVSYRGVGDARTGDPVPGAERRAAPPSIRAESECDPERGSCSLAVAYRAGNTTLAVSLFEETLKLRKGKLGPDHPDTLKSMNNLVVGYLTAGKMDVALPLYEQTLKIMKAKLGPEHPHTLESMNNLATAYQVAGNLDLALPLLEETLKLMKAKLGPRTSQHSHLV